MRAVFLGGNGTGRESGGTGVFLPRTVGSGSESKRKPGNFQVLNNVIDVFNCFVITRSKFLLSKATHLSLILCFRVCSLLDCSIADSDSPSFEPKR